jgi:hypothetical protein
MLRLRIEPYSPATLLLALAHASSASRRPRVTRRVDAPARGAKIAGTSKRARAMEVRRQDYCGCTGICRWPTRRAMIERTPKRVDLYR